MLLQISIKDSLSVSGGEPDKSMMIIIVGIFTYLITAYCNKREEQCTFKFKRIDKIEILNI